MKSITPRRLLLLALLAPLFSLNSLADPVEVDGIYYNLDPYDKTAVVTKRTSGNYSGSIVIPPSITIAISGTTYSVVGIEDEAFLGCESLTSVSMPNSITHIGGCAFEGCSNLISVTISNSVTYIGYNAFHGCSSLISVTIPDSVTGIGYYAFSNCSSLTSITIPESVGYIGEYVFSYCSSLTSITLPNSVTSIGNGAFCGCINLTSVTIPNSVISIGSTAFASCSSLTSVTIPESVTSIGNSAFNGCSSLTSVTIPKSVTKVPGACFNDCSNLTSVTIPNSVTSIDYYAFYGCSCLTSVVSLIQEPFSFGDFAFYFIASNCVLTVPAGTKEAYFAAGWTEEVFKGGIVEAEPNVSVTIGSTGAATFCCEEALDFSGTEEVKAYIVSAFHPATGKVTLTRITDVPAGTGIVLLGNAGTYDIPLGTGETYVVNMLVGVTADKVLNKTEGANSNFILANGENGVGFYAVKDGSTLAAGKAYLSLPTAVLPSSAQSIGFRFEDATNIASPQPSPGGKGDWYDLNGRRVNGAPTAPGLYIKDGRKVIVK